MSTLPPPTAKGRKWWMEADEPWQTLACCMEVARAVRTPDPTAYVSHLPVHQVSLGRACLRQHRPHSGGARLGLSLRHPGSCICSLKFHCKVWVSHSGSSDLAMCLWAGRSPFATNLYLSVCPSFPSTVWGNACFSVLGPGAWGLGAVIASSWMPLHLGRLLQWSATLCCPGQGQYGCRLCQPDALRPATRRVQ